MDTLGSPRGHDKAAPEPGPVGKEPLHRKENIPDNNIEGSENTPENASEKRSLDARDPTDSDSLSDYPSKDAHVGVQKVEAVALVWTKKVVWCTYAW